MKIQDIVDFIFELGQLKRVRSAGQIHLGVKNPDSINDHALRAAQIGYFLAKLEKYHKPQEGVTIIVFHDIGECRVGDIDNIAKRYIKNKTEVETKAVKDQLKFLEQSGKEIFSFWQQQEFKNTKAGIIARDADLLEHAFSAKEYLELGFKPARVFFQNIKKMLQTKSAKQILLKLEKTHSKDWWSKLAKIKKEK